MTTIETEFEQEFWPNVPTKIGKGAARRAYAKARAKADKGAILTGLATYHAYEKQRRSRDKSEYRPLHPATWLNQERWLDEPIEAQERARMPLCDCGCGQPATNLGNYGRFFSRECRKKVLGW